MRQDQDRNRIASLQSRYAVRYGLCRVVGGISCFTVAFLVLDVDLVSSQECSHKCSASPVEVRNAFQIKHALADYYWWLGVAYAPHVLNMGAMCVVIFLLFTASWLADTFGRQPLRSFSLSSFAMLR